MKDVYHLETGNKPKIVAGYDLSSVVNAYYTETWTTLGASYLQVNTNSNFSSEDQAYYAGYIEGYLTTNLLSWWLVNNSVLCTGSGCDVIDKVPMEFATKNLEWMQEQVKNNQNDPWWYQCGLVFQQIQGMIDGYLSTNPHDPINTGNPPLTITFSQMYINTLAAADMDDLPCIACKPTDSCYSDCTYVYLPGPPSPPGPKPRPYPKKRTRRRHPPFNHCSAVVLLLQDNSDLFVGHGTWDDYNAMIKLYRSYNFQFSQSANDDTIIQTPGTCFSGYPGVLVSGDDFYMTSSGIAMISSEIGPAPAGGSIYQNHNYKYDNVRMSALRIIIGLRLTSNISDLAKMMYLQDSGTGNNDWLVVDYKKFKPDNFLVNDTVWYFGSYPGMIKTYDVSSIINNNGYMGLYNIPYDPSLYTYGGWPGDNAQQAIDAGFDETMVDNLYSYDNNPRALIVAAQYASVETLDDFKALIRFNDWSDGCENNDPPCLAVGPGLDDNGDPLLMGNPWNAMLSRGDLVPDTEEADFPADLQPECFGGIDGKVINALLMRQMNFWTITSPAYEGGTPPFSFSGSIKSNPDAKCDPNDFPISQIVDKWQFPWVLTNWPVPVPTPIIKKKKTNWVFILFIIGLTALIGIYVYHRLTRNRSPLRRV